MKELNAYQEKRDMAEGILLKSMDAGPSDAVLDIEDPRLMYEKLCLLYKANDYTARHEVLKRYSRSSVKDFKSVAAYGENMKRAVADLQGMGHTMPEWMTVSYFIHGLNKTYVTFISIIIQTIGTTSDGKTIEPTFDSVLSKAIDHERRAIDDEEAKPIKGLKVESRNTLRTPSKTRQFRQNDKSDGPTCHYCEKVGHIQRYCWYKDPSQAIDGWKERNKDEVERLKKKNKEQKKPEKPENKANAARDGSPEGLKIYRAGNRDNKDTAWWIESEASIPNVPERGVPGYEALH